MSPFETCLVVALSVLSICLILVMIRFIKGPSLPDRVTAFDLFSAIIIAATAIYAVLTNNTSFMDVAIILSLISFLGAMSFAYYLNKK